MSNDYTLYAVNIWPERTEKPFDKICLEFSRSELLRPSIRDALDFKGMPDDFKNTLRALLEES